MNEDSWLPVDPALHPHLFREYPMRAVKRIAGSDESMLLDLPNYMASHMALFHLIGANTPLTITMWMDTSQARVARIIRFGPQRHVVELRDKDSVGILEHPETDDVEQYVTPAEQDVLGHPVLASSQIVIGSVTASTTHASGSTAARCAKGSALSPGRQHPTSLSAARLGSGAVATQSTTRPGSATRSRAPQAARARGRPVAAASS